VLLLGCCVCSFESYQAQAQIPSIQGTAGVYFAGAWCSYGFHEDGIKAATAAVKLMGAPIPWPLISCSPKISPGQMLFFRLFDK
jgi:predicted NAD/FAD-binding protein